MDMCHIIKRFRTRKVRHYNRMQMLKQGEQYAIDCLKGRIGIFQYVTS